MTRLEAIRLRKQEKQIADVIALPLALVISILFYLARFLSKLLWKVKKQVYKLALITFTVFFLTNFFGVYATAPKVQAALDVPKIAGQSAQLTEHDQIEQYIEQVFGKDAPNALKILSCENASLNPHATGHNTNGSIDYGIFQINSVHGIPAEYLYNWKINVDVAYQLFKEQGWTPWACVTVYHVLDK